MAAIAALTLRDPILPLVSTFQPEDLTKVKVENRWDMNVAAGQVPKYAKHYLPVCDDPSKKELFIHVINEFLDACDDSRLHLSTGPLRYNKFRQVLEGSLRVEWQSLSDDRTTANQTTVTFAEDLRTLLLRHFTASSREDQLEYLRGATKPYSMSVAALSARLSVISFLGRLLPGSWTPGAQTHLYTTEEAKKRALFNMMPMAWRIKFAETTHNLDDVNYSYAEFTRYMGLLEAVDKRGRGQKRQQQGQGRGRAGRGRTGGRGGGYSSYQGGRGGSPYRSGRGGFQGRFGGRGFGSPRTPNPFVTAAGGGRFGPSYGQGRGITTSPPGRGTPPGDGRRVSNSPSPRRFTPRRGNGNYGRGRGPTPYFPTFTTEDHYHQGYVSAPADAMDQYVADQYYQDQYYQTDEQAGGEAYFGDQEAGDEMYYQGQSDEQYYGGEGEQYSGQDEMYHQEEEGHDEEHFLQDFGY